ncbi:MAG: HD domain-containing protein [Bacillota bacterium]|nr:HD domain-containing protein [Bacillota bacterium]
MKKSKKDSMRKDTIAILQPVLQKPEVEEMKLFIQHGKMTTYEHCINVAVTCYILAMKFKLKLNIEVLVLSAFLHDFYLYDWHKTKVKGHLHGFVHSKIAGINAGKLLNQPQQVTDVIETHMWPLTFRHIPRTKEGWIVCFVDKYVSMKESLRGLFGGK